MQLPQCQENNQDEYPQKYKELFTADNQNQQTHVHISWAVLYMRTLLPEAGISGRDK